MRGERKKEWKEPFSEKIRKNKKNDNNKKHIVLIN